MGLFHSQRCAPLAALSLSLSACAAPSPSALAPHLAPSSPGLPAPVSSAPSDAKQSTSEPPEPDESLGLPPVPVENADSLAPFFARLADLESGRATTDVRVVQFGDSHTQPDLETATVRRALQARFGDGGRGFIPFLLPYKGWLQTGVQAGVPKEWVIARMKMTAPKRSKHDSRSGAEKPKLVGDGFYGLAGVSAAATRPGGRLWLDVPPASQIEIAYLAQPRGGGFDVFVDGAQAARVSTFAKNVASAYRALEVNDAPHRIEFEARGGGEARILGVTLDRAPLGITLDALGIGGSRASGILDLNEAHFADQVRHRAPDLVVFAYGTNEAGYDVEVTSYEKQLTEVILRVKRGAPQTACLLLGPPDWVQRGAEGSLTPQKLLDVIAVQRRVASAQGCAYFDQFEVMGGAGTMEDWASASPPLARPDRVHMTKSGYERLGAAFATALLAAYDGWQAARPPPLPNLAPPSPEPPISDP